MHAASMCENKFLYKSLYLLCCQCVNVLQPQFTLFQLWSHLPSTGPICENFQRNVWEDTCHLDDVANAAFNLHLHCGPHQIATSLCRDALILSMALTTTQHNYYLHQMNIDDLNRSIKFKFNTTITHITKNYHSTSKFAENVHSATTKSKLWVNVCCVFDNMISTANSV